MRALSATDYLRGLRRLLSRHKGEAALALALLLTIAAISFEDRLLERRLRFAPEEAVQPLSYVYDDRASGGRSTAALDPRAPMAWRCEIREGFAHPFCGFELLFDPLHSGKGIDLSHFKTVTLDFTYTGPTDLVSFHARITIPHAVRPRPSSATRFRAWS